MNTAFIYLDRLPHHKSLPAIGIDDRSNNQAEMMAVYVGAVAHELRTTISGLVMVSRIAKQADHEQKDHYLDILHTVGKETLHTLENMLTTVKVKRGVLQVSVQNRVFELNGWLQSSIEPICVFAKLHHRRISVSNYPATKQVRLQTDKEKLGQVLHNLLSNAIRFAFEDTEIVINCRNIGNDLCIEVTNMGTAIPPEKLSHIFEPFVQISKTSTGSGLGLYISKLYTEAMGGNLLVSSDNSNTIFTVHIPSCIIQ